MGSGPHFEVLRARDARPWETMVVMRTRLTITKTTTALATSALLVLGLAACGGSGDDASTDADTTAAEETSSPADEETTATEEPAEEESGDTEASGDFCTAYDALLDAQTTLSSIDTSDPAAAVTQFETFTASLEAAEAPAEISTDWDNVTGVFRQLTDTIETAVDDPANADISSITSLKTAETYQASAQNVAVYGTQNC